MKRVVPAAVLIVATAYTGMAFAVDLTKIERKIAKEPAYFSSSVGYCLLVFGPAADKRVWLAWDGKDLYVDRNGNGNLGEPGERILGPRKPPAEDELVQLGTTQLTAFGDECTLETTLERGVLFLTLEGNEIHRFYASPKLVNKIAAAPIVHFNGALTMALNDRELLCNDKPAQVFAVIGTPGLGEGSFASISHAAVPEKAHPVAEIEFASAEANGRPLTVSVELAERC
jgi:hypothetical protein